MKTKKPPGYRIAEIQCRQCKHCWFPGGFKRLRCRTNEGPIVAKNGTCPSAQLRR